MSEKLTVFIYAARNNEIQTSIKKTLLNKYGHVPSANLRIDR